MIRSVYKNQKPVTYDIPKPFKKVFTEEDLYIADKKTFGSLIGPLTNRGTSIIALITEYEERVKQYGLEEDKKKLELLHNRLKMVCAGQSRQIDEFTSLHTEMYVENVCEPINIGCTIYA